MRTKGRWHDAMTRRQDASPSKAVVAWTAEDIRELIPHWTIDRCNEWLIDNEERLIKEQIRQGFFLIEMMLDQQEHLQDPESNKDYDWVADPNDINILG